MGGIDHFTKLLAWQKNHELVLEIYKITQKFPNRKAVTDFNDQWISVFAI